MARSRRKSRTVSKGLTALLVGGCGIFAGYYFWPSGEADVVADASAPTQHNPLSQASQATVGQLLTKKADPAGDLAKPAGKPETRIQPPTTPPTTKPSEPEARTAASTINANAGFLADATAFQNQGKLLEARAVLNDALQRGTLSPADAEGVKGRIRDLNQTIIFTPSRRYKDDPQQSEHTVAAGDSLAKICRELDVPYAFIARINAVKPDKIRLGQSLKLIQGPIHAVVSKKNFTMDLYLGGLPGQPGSVYLETYNVGLGEDSSTPTGTWEVSRNSKTANPAWTNPRTNETFDRDDPKNPLGERWIGLTGIAGNAVGAVSYGIHGTIDPASIGTNASMGCIRLADGDIDAIFDMFSEGKSTVLVTE